MQLLGLCASAFIIASVTTRSLTRLRLIGLAGGLSFVVYGFVLEAWPVVITNATTASINIFHLLHVARERTSLRAPVMNDRLLATPKGQLAARIAAQTELTACARPPHRPELRN